MPRLRKLRRVYQARRTRRYTPLAVLMLLLTGCYFPGSFDAEIEISRNGLYKMSFDGYIVELNHYRDLASGKIKPGDKRDKERQETVLRDFNRDSRTKSSSYYQQGAYQVNWSMGGDLLKTTQIMFLRRNSNMFSIIYDKDEFTMTVRGKFVSKKDKDRLEALGITMQGVLRIKTDARVLSHNANLVTKQGPVTIYGWRINNLRDPAPKLVATLR